MKSSIQDSKMVIRTILIDDELQMRRYLRELLREEPRVAIVGEAANGLEGATKIRALSPDLVFLDIQMPELDGFDLISEVGIEKMPAVVFVTAYSEYAPRAFEVNAVDYLCKPFDRDRLAASLQKAVRTLSLRDNRTVSAGSPSHHLPDQWASRIAVNENDEIVFVPVRNIRWIEAANKYVVGIIYLTSALPKIRFGAV